MANINHRTLKQSRAIFLEFERNILDEKIHAAAKNAGLTAIVEYLEDASKIIGGLGTLCKLARNHQDIASGASEEDLLLSLATMEYLFSLGEVAARRFIFEIESVADGKG